MSIITNTVYGPGGFDPAAHDNNVISVETINAPQAPLPPVGVLATLLAVTEVLTVEDAANAVGLMPADLVAEAQAWGTAE